MNNTLHYIIRFLLGEEISDATAHLVGYTANQNHFDRYRVVIIPSGFFDTDVYGTPASVPSLPLQETEGIPLLFGSQKVEWVGDTWVVHADIIASTYFLITRYEEMIHRDLRDEHGRFPGKESLPYRAGFLHRPIVDEYRQLLRRWLRQSRVPVPEVEAQISKVYLTHDVDAPFLYRSWKGVIRSLLNKRGLVTSLKGKFGSFDNDPYYTFPWLFQQNDALRDQLGKEHCQSILFFRAGGKAQQDKPHYSLHSKELHHLLQKCTAHEAAVGLHSSYQAGIRPEKINKEKKTLEEQAATAITFNRHHYLACREPEDMDRLEAEGFTDDFTMGYADLAGFRLGTSHPVRWINPVNRRLSSLTLHPLIIMDCTLEEANYMHFDYEQAFTYCLRLIEEVKKAGGELVMLWHNTSARQQVIKKHPNSYLRKLYENLLNELKKI
ncbi:MAG: polysaccharide deacetylase family protein [Tannerellaceae bacterium]